jgi:hypothetical protein
MKIVYNYNKIFKIRITPPPPPQVSNREGRTKRGEAVISQESKYPDPPPTGKTYTSQQQKKEKKRKERKIKEKKRKEERK